jgi:hypothetical protein
VDLDDIFGNTRHQRHDQHWHGPRRHDEHHHDDDLDEGRHGYYGDRDDRDHHGDNRRWSGRHERGHGELLDLERLAHQTLANKKVLVLACVVFVIVLVLAAIFLLPLLGQAVDYVDQSGVKGVIDRVLQGTGGGK